jgi:hypothetical protein
VSGVVATGAFADAADDCGALTGGFAATANESGACSTDSVITEADPAVTVGASEFAAVAVARSRMVVASSDRSSTHSALHGSKIFSIRNAIIIR